MRAASGAMAAVLPISPFVTYLYLGSYPRPLIYALAGATEAIGAVGVLRGRGSGRAGLFSAFASMIMLALSTGYIPYFSGFSLGYIGCGALFWLSLSIGLSLYAYFLGNVYDASTRIVRRMKELGYDEQSIGEVDSANALAIASGAVALLASAALTLLVRELRGAALAPLTALVVFVTVYLVAMAVGRARRGDSG